MSGSFPSTATGFDRSGDARQAVERVERLLHEGYVWVVDADLKGYFDSIPQRSLLDRVAEKVADGRVLRLLRGYLEQGVMDTAKGWQPTEQGTPQGAVISPLLANIYLNPLDHQMAAAGWEMTRYADDFIVQCRSRAEAQAALEQLKDVDPGCRADPTPAEDTHRGRQPARRLRLPGLAL